MYSFCNPMSVTTAMEKKIKDIKSGSPESSGYKMLVLRKKKT